MWNTLHRLNYRHILTDLFLISLSFYLSLWLRIGSDPDLKMHLAILNKYIPLFVTLRIATFVSFGVYDIIWRYISLKDATKLARAVLFSSLLIIAATYIVDIGRLPRSIFFIDASLSLILLSGIRFARRLMLEYRTNRIVQVSVQRALIIGAGTNGRSLAARLSHDNDVNLRLMGFIDDDAGKVGRLVSGNRVLGDRTSLARFIKELEITEVIIAISKPPADALRHVVQVCRTFGIRPRLMRGMQPNSRPGKTIETFTDIELGDLLNRPRTTLDTRSIEKLIHGRTVLVTGAGGSIGSELCRQILNFHPSRLLLLDHSEFNLYTVDQELRGTQTEGSNVVPLLIDIKDKRSLENAFRLHKPQLVFHAAAYKHVHLVEANPNTAILNNILGTQNLLNLSAEANVDGFVMISTDKAVNPVGIMGATKRVCELMVAELGREVGKLYCSVRFGNVLGSSGSLVPLLTQQIKNGEPITITHPDMNRFFMLISEAVSLVLKAATITAPGDIAILDMGKPIKIVDVARSLFALIGPTDTEAPIVFTGQRPGEKLFEELYLCGNEIKTEHEGILVVPRGDGNAPKPQNLEARIALIIEMAREGKTSAADLVKGLARDEARDEELFPTAPALPVTRPERPTTVLN